MDKKEAEKSLEEIKKHLRETEEDMKKTSFITDWRAYCYRVMTFNLNNSEATYQRLVQKIFKAQLGQKIEAYIDDMLLKSMEEADHMAN